MKKLLKDNQGIIFVEMLWVIPILLMMFLFIVESACIMYDFAIVNYYTSTAAEKAAMNGGFDDSIRLSLQNNLSKWTIDGKKDSFDTSGTSANYTPGQVVIYGTDRNLQVQRNDEIEVGTVYPVQFKTFIIRDMFQWAIEEKQFSLKSQAVSTSEKFFD